MRSMTSIIVTNIKKEHRNISLHTIIIVRKKKNFPSHNGPLAKETNRPDNLQVDKMGDRLHLGFRKSFGDTLEPI